MKIWRGTTVAVLAAAVVGCSGAPDATPSPSAVLPSPTTSAGASLPLSPAPSPSAAVVSNPPAGTPSPTPTAPPPATTPPTVPPHPDTAPTWTHIGESGDDAFIVGVAGFSAGYVVAYEDLDGAAFAFSPNGRDWEVGQLGEPTASCDGSPTPDSFGTGVATDGQAVLILGGTLEFTAENCGNPDLGFGGGVVTWLSTDGLTWTRSEPFAHRHAIARHAWPIPGGGWEVVTSSFDAPTTIWQSADGSAWEEVASFPEQVGYSSRGAADAAGTRLLEVQADEEPLRLMSSTDGVNWTALPAQPALSEFAFVTDILPSTGAARPWIVVTADDLVGSSIYASASLGSWARHDFPGQRIVTSILASAGGYLATAERVDRYFGECDGIGCPGPAERQYISADGVAWNEVGPRLRGGAFFAEGRAGVIAIGRYDGIVWLLEP